VADIERGGVFAQIVGTWELLEADDRARVVGFLINKFRGDVRLLDPGLEFLHDRTGVPVLGVLPHRPDLQIDQEDSLGLEETATAAASTETADGRGESTVVAVAMLPGLSNATDFWPLSRVPGVKLRYVARGADLGRPDLIILPGTKSTVHALGWLRSVGLAGAIDRLMSDVRGPMLLGVCGGFQMLGRRIEDPLGVESDRRSVEGLGMLDVATRFTPEKARYRVSGQEIGSGLAAAGYEIHMGVTERGTGVEPWLDVTRERTGERLADGARDGDGRVFGTYLHGLFDNPGLTAAIVNRLRERRGLTPLGAADWRAHRDLLANRYSGLATLLREYVDLDPVWAALGRSAPMPASPAGRSRGGWS
jgi:adenosylcobyric acid synthase